MITSLLAMDIYKATITLKIGRLPFKLQNLSEYVCVKEPEKIFTRAANDFKSRFDSKYNVSRFTLAEKQACKSLRIVPRCKQDGDDEGLKNNDNV